MKFIIIGSGIVGLSIAKSLIEKKICEAEKILIVDKYSIPSKGTSRRNSGVLHAGLYYEPGSLKAKLSIQGGIKLKEWCNLNNIPILNCGKILVPFEEKDYANLDKIEQNASKNGCDIKIIDHNETLKIQPGLVKKERYLWSPKTSVFSPSLIIENLYSFLKEIGVKFMIDSVIRDESEKKQLIFKNHAEVKYFRYINCAGPGALDLAKTITDKFNHLTILPFLGQYVLQKSGIKIQTNIYPVPDPQLPFLGIHITPRLNASPLIGPNALPVFQKDIQGYDLGDVKEIPKIITNNLIFLAANKCNYRNHAFEEFSINLRNKFLKNSRKYFTTESLENFQIEMDTSTYGIRAQIINRNSYEFINDFIYKEINGNIHIVNAVSPAFTSCFSLSEFIVDKLT
tara:strand:- start:2508 stop:3704 length:1197 start_codon:yes stop_codon:yes gene_type:complete